MTNVRDYLNEGDIVQVLIKGRDAKGRLDLSIKDLTPAPKGARPAQAQAASQAIPRV